MEQAALFCCRVPIFPTCCRPYADAGDLPAEDFAALAAALRIQVSDLKRLHLLWGEDFVNNLLYIREHRKSMTLRLIAGSLADYRRATASWWNELCEELDGGCD